MIYLILAIACSAMVSIFMRISEKFIRNNMGMFLANYAVCVGFARALAGGRPVFVRENGIGFAAGLGILSGMLYLVSFMLLQWNIRKNGVVLSSTFMKLGVLVPTLMAIVVFHERPKAIQLAGVAVAVVAIVLIQFEKESVTEGSRKGWLLVLLFAGGFTDSLANIYDKTGVAGLKDHYLFFTFLAAMICAGILAIRSRKKVSGYDILFGALIGIPNYFSARFLLLALGSVPAVITYPVYSTATIVVISLVGVLAFGEQISTRKKIAIGSVIVALILLNL